ncbi:START domain-containing protein 10-like, partial [Saccoglossus kowalevskii]
MPIERGKVSVPDDDDFQDLKNLAEDHSGWTIQYSKNNGAVCVWTKDGGESESCIKMFKVYRNFPDVKAETMYDVLHDPHFRKLWDKSMIEGRDVCMVNPNND